MRFGLRDGDDEARARLIQRLKVATDELFLTTAETALVLAVTPATVRRWADQGRLVSVRSLGGHRRFLGSAVRDLMGGTAKAIP